MFDNYNNLCTPFEIQGQLRALTQLEKSMAVSQGERSLAALTTLERTEWATIRNHYFDMVRQKERK